MSFQKIKGKNEIVLYKAQMFDRVYQALPPDIYQLADLGGMFEEIPCFRPFLQREHLIDFKGGILQQFLNEVTLFFSDKVKEAYSEMKIVHKTGYILYGKPGTGKTCICALAMKKMSESFGAICLDATKVRLDFVKRTISQIREIQDNPIVLFFDECDEDLSSDENSFLPFLDGNESVSGLIFLGCTNYIDRISSRIKNRKSRIKKCFEITSLPTEVFKQYLIEKLPSMADKIISEFCYKASEAKLNIDQFKNAVLDYKLNSMSIDSAIKESQESYGEEDRKTPPSFTINWDGSLR